MEIWQAIILGIVQGVGEFLPISSSGHLILARSLMNISGDYLLFDIMLHVGTLGAVCVYFFKDILALFKPPFKKMGLLLEGSKVKVYLFDWTGNGLHHVGYLPEEASKQVIPYLEDMDKYSFALCGLITGGKCKTITKDEKTGKITVSKGKDGNYGIDLDITIIPRKD